MLLELLQSITIAVGLAAALTIALALVLPFLRSANSFFLCTIIPSVVLILTQVVSSNLYLSLGLIGALSIVRFRTPVKSQVELGHLFLLIGVGVATGVNPIYALALTVAVIASVPVYGALSNLFPNVLVFERRFNSSSRVEVTIRYKNPDLARVSLNPSNGRVVRVDKSDNSLELFLSFADLASALRFISDDEIEIESYCILNS